MSMMFRIANPVVGLILRSPLNGMMSRSLLLVAYRGRRSGQEHTLPVQYVRDGQSVYILVGNAEQKTWWRNLRGGQPVRLMIAGRSVAGRAEVWQGEGDVGRIAPALRLYLHRFPAAAAGRSIRTQGGGDFNADDLQQEARSAVMVHVALS